VFFPRREKSVIKLSNDFLVVSLVVVLVASVLVVTGCGRRGLRVASPEVIAPIEQDIDAPYPPPRGEPQPTPKATPTAPPTPSPSPTPQPMPGGLLPKLELSLTNAQGQSQPLITRGQMPFAIPTFDPSQLEVFGGLHPWVVLDSFLSGIPASNRFESRVVFVAGTYQLRMSMAGAELNAPYEIGIANGSEVTHSPSAGCNSSFPGGALTPTTCVGLNFAAIAHPVPFPIRVSLWATNDIVRYHTVWVLVVPPPRVPEMRLVATPTTITVQEVYEGDALISSVVERSVFNVALDAITGSLDDYFIESTDASTQIDRIQDQFKVTTARRNVVLIAKKWIQNSREVREVARLTVPISYNYRLEANTSVNRPILLGYRYYLECTYRGTNASKILLKSKDTDAFTEFPLTPASNVPPASSGLFRNGIFVPLEKPFAGWRHPTGSIHLYAKLGPDAGELTGCAVRVFENESDLQGDRNEKFSFPLSLR
jgi:hypothetical protein